MSAAGGKRSMAEAPPFIPPSVGTIGKAQQYPVLFLLCSSPANIHSWVSSAGCSILLWDHLRLALPFFLLEALMPYCVVLDHDTCPQIHGKAA